MPDVHEHTPDVYTPTTLGMRWMYPATVDVLERIPGMTFGTISKGCTDRVLDHYSVNPDGSAGQCCDRLSALSGSMVVSKVLEFVFVMCLYFTYLAFQDYRTVD